MKFPVQENVLRLQIMMQEGRVHVVEKINPQGNLIQNPEAQRPVETRVDVFLQGGGGRRESLGVLTTTWSLCAVW